MKFYLTDTKEKKEITVRNWNGSGYDPDCFYDLEINFPENHERIDGGDAYICTSDEYEELKDWWEDEIEAMNSGTQAHAWIIASKSKKIYAYSQIEPLASDCYCISLQPFHVLSVAAVFFI